MICDHLNTLKLLRSVAIVFNSFRVILGFPVNRLASAITTVCNVFLCLPCERLLWSGAHDWREWGIVLVAAHLAFWLRAQTIDHRSRIDP